MYITILKNLIFISEVIVNNLEKVSKYQLSCEQRNDHLLKETWKLRFRGKTQKTTKCKK
jgi:hypothetical protein